MRGSGSSVSVKMSTGTPSHSAARAQSRNARTSIGAFSVSDSYKRAMPKPTQSSQNNAARTGSTPANARLSFAQIQKADACELQQRSTG